MKLLIVILSCLFVAITAEKFCSSGSLDKLKLVDLIKKSKIDEDCKNEARKVFERNYNQAYFLVQKSEFPIVESSKNFIVLVDEYLIKVLSNFGDLVQKLTINAADISKEALSLLNEKSSESLKELGFELLNGENIVDWKNSFNNVKELSLIGASNFTSNKTFNEFFPNVEKLNVQNLFDWSFVESSFKNVKTLEFAFEPNNINDANEKQISTFFTNNQQIETLTLRKPSKKLFNIVANLTNLKSLELLLTENVDSTGDDVHFKTVKKLKIQSTSNFIPNGIIFDKLEDITLELKDFDKNWVEFIAKKLNKDTQQLTLEQGFLTQERFSNISTFLPELKFVYIINNQLTDKTNAEWIVTFIKSSKKLNALFSDLQMEKTEQNKLKEDLKKDKWKVEIIDEDESKNRIHLSIRNSASLINHSALLTIAAFIVAFTKFF